MTFRRIANIFMERLVASLKIRYTVLMNNGPQFTSKFVAALCKELSIRKIETTEYYLQANEQFGNLHGTMILRQNHYVAEHLKNWDTFVSPLTYA